MNYTSFSDFKYGWIFRHRELPIPSETLEQIRPLDKASANQIWRTQISKEATHALHFLGDDWPSRNGVWQEKIDWQQAWESDHPDLPAALLEHLAWESNVTVYFCYAMDQVVQTRWDVFTRHWKNFLFCDDGPILIGRKRRQAVWFHSDGSCQLGLRPEAG